ncbi:hypothetical protein BZG36_05277, partial [Bifiguratus adelaidae]
MEGQRTGRSPSQVSTTETLKSATWTAGEGKDFTAGASEEAKNGIASEEMATSPMVETQVQVVVQEDPKEAQAGGEKMKDENDFLPFKQLMLVYIGLCLAIFTQVASLNSTIVAVALPTIAGQFGSLGEISWVGTAYLLTTTALLPLYGRFSDIFGRKPVILFGVVT